MKSETTFKQYCRKSKILVLNNKLIYQKSRSFSIRMWKFFLLLSDSQLSNLRSFLFYHLFNSVHVSRKKSNSFSSCYGIIIGPIVYQQNVYSCFIDKANLMITIYKENTTNQILWVANVVSYRLEKVFQFFAPNTVGDRPETKFATAAVSKLNCHTKLILNHMKGSSHRSQTHMNTPTCIHSHTHTIA